MENPSLAFGRMRGMKGRPTPLEGKQDTNPKNEGLEPDILERSGDKM